MRKLMMALFIAALALPASAGEKQEGETILKDSQPAGAVPSEDSSDDSSQVRVACFGVTPAPRSFAARIVGGLSGQMGLEANLPIKHRYAYKTIPGDTFGSRWR